MPEMTYRKALCKGKCPRCRQGDIFKFPLFNVGHFWKMNAHCANCGMTFEPEPGFYFGAMFISYAFSVALLAVIGVGLFVLFRPHEWVYLTTVIVSILLFTPFSFRYSRIFFLYFFGGIHFDEGIR